MAVKDGAEQIIGKTIKGVVIKKAKPNCRPPAMQLFLLFEDGTYYEFYTFDCSISTTSGVAVGDLSNVIDYMSDVNEPIFVKYQE